MSQAQPSASGLSLWEPRLVMQDVVPWAGGNPSPLLFPLCVCTFGDQRLMWDAMIYCFQCVCVYCTYVCICTCVCIFACACLYAYVCALCMCACMCVHLCKGHWVSCSITSHIILFRQGLSLNLDLGSQPPSPSAPPVSLFSSLGLDMST